MRITCDVIKDLLPLYAEGMTSEDSRVLVDEHICGCESCQKVLAEMGEQTPIPVEADPKSLAYVKRMIIRKRIMSVMASLLSLVTLASFVVTFLFTPFQLTKEQALDDFYVREDGAVVVDYSSAVVDRMFYGRDDNRYLIEYSTRYDMWKGQNRKSLWETFGSDGVITEEERLRYENIEVYKGSWLTPEGNYHTDSPQFAPEGDGWTFVPESQKNWWYADPNGLGKDTLLHNAEKDWAEVYQFGPVYPVIFFGGIAATLLLYVICRRTRKNWVQELAARLLSASASGTVSVWIVSSGRIFSADTGIIDQYWSWMIGMNTVFLTLTILLWRQLYLINRQDRGI